jgi:uncharacterized SAM-binding protein YcdF (DUF218 family)
MAISSILKSAFTPGSRSFLIVCLAVWPVLRYVWPRSPRCAGGWLLTIAGTYLVLGLPWVANALADRLTRPRPDELASLRAVDTLVVLDGDNRVGRVRQAERVYAVARPGAVRVLGAVWVATALAKVGIPQNRIVQDASAATTRDQMAWVQRLLAQRPADRTALIASRLQMPRVVALAKAAGLQLTLVPSPIDTEPPTTGVWLFVPTYLALRVSRDALYEHAALAYYTWRGWIKRT